MGLGAVVVVVLALPESIEAQRAPRRPCGRAAVLHVGDVPERILPDALNPGGDGHAAQAYAAPEGTAADAPQRGRQLDRHKHVAEHEGAVANGDDAQVSAAGTDDRRYREANWPGVVLRALPPDYHGAALHNVAVKRVARRRHGIKIPSQRQRRRQQREQEKKCLLHDGGLLSLDYCPYSVPLP